MQNNYPSDGSKKLATVTAVDITRAVCKCVCDDGEVMADVRWVVPMGGADGFGASYHPIENSRVLVDLSSGFPFILGAILTESARLVTRPNIGRQSANEPQIADYTTIPVGDLIRGPGTPTDQRVGDAVITSEGGGIHGVLASGTVINKASPLAQMICSRYGDLVRIVARNHEVFTDVDKDQKVSIRGSLYTRNDLFRDPVKSRAEVPNVVKYTGNVQAAELIQAVEELGYELEDEEGNVTHHKYTYASIPLEEFPAIPEDDFIVEKTYVFNNEVPAEGGPRVPVSTSTRDVEGSEVDNIQVTDGTIFMDHSLNHLREDTSFGTPDDASSQHQDALTVSSLVKKVDDSSISASTQIASEHKKEVRTGIKTNWWMNETEFQWDVDSGNTFINGNKDRVVISVGSGAAVFTVSADGNVTMVNSGTFTSTSGGAIEFNGSSATFNVDNNFSVNATNSVTTCTNVFRASAPGISVG